MDEALDPQPAAELRSDADPESTPFHQLDPRAVPYDRVARWIRIAVLVLLALILIPLMFALEWFSPWLRPLFAIAAAAGIGIEIVCAFVMPRLTYKYTSYRVSAAGLEIRSGVLWRSIVTVARSRVQHLDVTQGPIERNFELGRLHIHTAGTSNATVSLWGIDHETAKILRDDLGHWASDADGV